MKEYYVSQKRIIYMVFIFLLLAVVSLPAFSKAKKETGAEKDIYWVRETEYSANHNEHIITYAGFVDSLFGITVAGGGRIFYTKDMCATWAEAQNSSMCLFGLEIIDENTAYTCGNGGYVRKTTDRGKTWEHMKDFGRYEPFHCRFLSFISEKTGWIASPESVAFTTDGGGTWVKMELPENLQRIGAIDCTANNSGYILDDLAGILYTTGNNGNTWSEIPLGYKAGKTVDAKAPIAALRFFKDNSGIVLFRQFAPANRWIFLTTADKGNTWIEYPVSHDFGYVFISRDGKYLTITDLSGSKIQVFNKVFDKFLAHK